MSGECTVTPGKTWANETITDAKLNLAANPVVRVDENAIGARELDLVAIAPEISEVAKSRNWLRNPTFAEQWADGAHVSGQLVPTQAAGWWRRATGTAVVNSLNTVVALLPDKVGPGTLSVAVVTPGTSTGGIRIGQFIDAATARHLSAQTVTVSFYFHNAAGTATTPRVQIHGWQADNDRGTVLQVYDEPTVSVASGGSQWTRLSKTIDLASLAGLEYGFDLVIEVPAAMTSSGQVWRLSGAQLEISSAATAFTHAHPAGWSGRRDKYSGSATAPAWDITDGFLAGDTVTGLGRVWKCMDPQDGAPVWHREALPYNGIRWMQATEYDPATAQNLTTTYADLDGSSVTYTPKSATSQIIYRYVFHAATLSAGETILMHMQLLLDGAVQTESQTTFGDASATPQDVDVIYEHRLASWGVTAKTLKMQAREYSASFDTKIHETYFMDGALSSVLRRAVLTITELELAE